MQGKPSLHRFRLIPVIIVAVLLTGWLGLRGLVGFALRRASDGRLTWSSLSLFPAFELDTPSLVDEKGARILEIARLRVEYSLVAALHARSPMAAVRHVQLHSPRAFLRISAAEQARRPRFEGDYERMLDSFQGRVDIDDAEISLSDARADRSPSESAPAAVKISHLGLEVDGARHIAQLQLGVPLRLRASVAWPDGLRSAQAHLLFEEVDLGFWTRAVQAWKLLATPEDLAVDEVAGRVSADILLNLHGDDPPQLVGSARLDGGAGNITWKKRRIALSSWSGGVRFMRGLVHVDRLTGSVLGARLSLDGRVVGDRNPHYDLGLDIDCPDLAAVFRALHQTPYVGGSVHARLGLLGRPSSPLLDISVSSPRLVLHRPEIPHVASHASTKDQAFGVMGVSGHKEARGNASFRVIPPLRNVRVKASWKGGTLRIASLAADAVQGSVTASGYVFPPLLNESLKVSLQPALARWKETRLLMTIHARGVRLPSMAESSAYVNASIVGDISHPIISGNGGCRGLRVGAGQNLPVLHAVDGSFLTDTRCFMFNDVVCATSAGQVGSPAGFADVDPQRRKLRHLHAALRGRGLSAALASAGAVYGAGFNVVVDGDMQSWIAGGTAYADRVTASGREARSIHGAFVATPRTAVLAGARLSWQGMPLFASAAASLIDRSFGLTVAGIAFDPSRLPGARGYAPPGVGRLRIEAGGDPRSVLATARLAMPYGTYGLRGRWDARGRILAVLHAVGIDARTVASRTPATKDTNGRLDAEAVVTATRARADFNLAGTSEDLRVHGVPVRRAALCGSYDISRQKLRLNSAVLDSPWAFLSAYGDVEPRARRLALSWTAAVHGLGSVLSAVTPAAGVSLRHAALIGSGTISMTRASQHIYTQGTQLSLGDGGAIWVKGAVDRGRATWTDLTASLHNVRLASTQPYVDGEAGGRIRVVGLLPNPTVHGTLSVTHPYASVPRASALLAQQFHWHDATVSVAPERSEKRAPVHVEIDAKGPDAAIHGAGTWSPKGYFLDVSSLDYPVADVLRLAGVRTAQPPLSGAHADATLHVEGTDLQPDARLGIRIHGETHGEPWMDGSLAWNGHTRKLRLDPLRIAPPQGGTATLTGSLTMPRELPDLTLHWRDAIPSDARLDLTFNAFPLRPAVEAGTGSLSSLPDTLTRILTTPVQSGVWPKLDAKLHVTTGLRLQGEASLSGLAGTSAGNGTMYLAGSYSVKENRGQGVLQVDGVDLRAAATVLKTPPALDGRLDATLSAEGSPLDPTVDLALSLHDAATRGQMLGTLSARLKGTPGVYGLSLDSDVLGSSQIYYDRASGALSGGGTTLPRGRWSILGEEDTPSFVKSSRNGLVVVNGRELQMQLPVASGQKPSKLYLPNLDFSVLLQDPLTQCKLELTDPVVDLAPNAIGSGPGGESTDDFQTLLERPRWRLRDNTLVSLRVDRGLVHGSPIPPVSADLRLGPPNTLSGSMWSDTPLGRLYASIRDESPSRTRIFRRLEKELAAVPPTDWLGRIRASLHLACVRKELEPPAVTPRSRQQMFQQRMRPGAAALVLSALGEARPDPVRDVQSGRESVVDLALNVARTVAPTGVHVGLGGGGGAGLLSRFFLQLYRDPSPPVQPNNALNAWGLAYRLGRNPTTVTSRVQGQSVQAWIDSLGIYRLMYQLEFPFNLGTSRALKKSRHR